VIQRTISSQGAPSMYNQMNPNPRFNASTWFVLFVWIKKYMVWMGLFQSKSIYPNNSCYVVV